jgi:hypothetical protein
MFLFDERATCVLPVLKISGNSSVVEHRLAKARVASSNLVFRSNFKIYDIIIYDPQWRVKIYSKWYADGGIAKW